MDMLSKRCTKCGDLLLQVSGESGSHQMSCINCAGKVPVEKPGVQAEDPGEAYFSGGKEQTRTAVSTLPAKINVKCNDSSIDSAIACMRGLPMPKDVKQFKKVTKIVTLMEELKAEMENAH